MRAQLHRITNPLQAHEYFRAIGDGTKTVEELVSDGKLYFVNPTTGEMVEVNKSYFY
jgi:hypothetical protein